MIWVLVQRRPTHGFEGALMEQRLANGFEGALVVNEGAQLWICTLLALSLDNVTNQPLYQSFNTFTQTYNLTHH